MPMDTIDRAIKRAAGGGDGASLEEISYEGYGPGGAAVLVEALTDNRNRAVAEIRSAFTRAGGSLGESGCVAWLFEPRGVIAVEKGDQDPDEVGLVAIDAGAEDVRVEDGMVEVLTQPTGPGCRAGGAGSGWREGGVRGSRVGSQDDRAAGREECDRDAAIDGEARRPGRRAARPHEPGAIRRGAPGLSS